MGRNSNDEEMRKLLDHHNFIVITDRKSLHTQIKSLVHQAHEIGLKELDQRRVALHKLLETEDKIYEEEFTNNVKSRIDQDIKERKDILLKIKEESTKNEQQFLKSKRIQQYMNSCYEIRDALRHKELQEVKQCQLEQILEKERSLRNERQLDEYWYNVQQKNLEVANKRQIDEECLKQALIKHNTATLQVQQEEIQEKRDKLMKEKLEEKQKLDALIEEMRLEEFDRKLKRVPPKVMEYRNELFKMMEEKRMVQEKQEEQLNAVHRKINEEAKRLDEEEAAMQAANRKAFIKSTKDYIKYVQKMREIGEQQERLFSDRTDDLRRVDICTKANIQRERQKRAHIAEECYSELRKQMCEQQERRLREEAEYRECKMLENRFARDEITREQIIQQRLQNRKELDKQVAEMKKFREEEEKKFNEDLRQASNDPEFCSVLSERYIKQGIDYLEPHANWRFLECPEKIDFIKPTPVKVPKKQKQKIDMNFQPCGCMARGMYVTSPPDGSGDAKQKK